MKVWFNRLWLHLSITGRMWGSYILPLLRSPHWANTECLFHWKTCKYTWVLILLTDSEMVIINCQRDTTQYYLGETPWGIDYITLWACPSEIILIRLICVERSLLLWVAPCSKQGGLTCMSGVTKLRTSLNSCMHSFFSAPDSDVM